MRMCEKAWRNVQPNTIIVNCFKKTGFYFNEDQCDGHICPSYDFANCNSQTQNRSTD